ncbi:MAG: ATP-grasp domain-containing protein [Thiomonas arsenitoxydans]|jgi:hypothetical protein|nr:ATP-grasp domain-containing protein [Thiomonas arsenitoxydans]
MPTFVFQSDPVTLMEKRAVRHACALDDRFGIGQTMPLDLVASYLPGELRDYTPICPVGTVEFCRAWMRAVGVKEPAPIDYPECLRPALGRFIVTVPFEQARHGCWIKPVRTKAWEPHVMTAGEAIPVDERVWESAVIPEKDWIAEWRVYVLDGQIVGHGRYDDGPDESAVFDEGAVLSWIGAYTASGQAPSGYGLDVALLSDGRTILVEVTDGWAIGFYKGTCESARYAELLAARWAEIAK